MTTALDQLVRSHADSTWRLEALLAVGNSYLIENQVDAYEPLYRDCYESFPKDARAAGCHWKVTWAHYLRRQDDAAEMLRQHLRQFPNSDESSAALYFLARLAEGAGDPSSARAYYSEIVREYPNYFYDTGLAQARAYGRAEPVDGHGCTSPAGRIFSGRSRSTPAPACAILQPNATARLRLERARLLASGGLDDWAEVELVYAAQTEDQPHVMGLELATMASRRSQQDQAIRYLKRYAPDYLYMRIDSAPDEFWKLAFPLPYREDLEHYARQNNLDPFLVAALARQESEFNPNAVSPSSARGLTQIMPSTGRELSRQLRIKPYSTAKLFQPQVNLQLGTFYLKSVADSLEGRWEAALAAYNAGLSRAKAWSTWGEFREAAEFVETVPFTQTREYIQIILRNADIYRQLYANAKPDTSVSALAKGATPTPPGYPIQMGSISEEKVLAPPAPLDRRPRFRSERAAGLNESVIREMTRLAFQYNAVNLAQGYPDFPAPEILKRAAIAAIEADINQYSIHLGRQAVSRRHRRQVSPALPARLRPRARNHRRLWGHRRHDRVADRRYQSRRRTGGLRTFLRKLRAGFGAVRMHPQAGGAAPARLDF